MAPSSQELEPPANPGRFTDDFVAIDANALSDQEIKDTAALFQIRGFWGNLADFSTDRKERFIAVDCQRSYARLIMLLYEQSKIGEKIRTESGQLINSDSDLARIVTLCFVLARLDQRADAKLLTELLNFDIWTFARDAHFKAAGEFVKYENGAVEARSPILATFILNEVLNPKYLIGTIEQVVRRLEGLRRTHVLHRIFTELQRFPVIEGMILDRHSIKRDLIIGYFQSIKETDYCNQNALFWLHYAMARLAFGEFETAEIHFKQAKKFAEKNPKQLIDVNNHYARLLLDSRIKTDDYNDYFKAFLSAHEILIEQMNKQSNRYYPYRQAKKYVEFVSYRKNKLGAGQIKQVRAACNQVKRAIENLRGEMARSSVVSECSQAMDRTIELLDL